MINSKERYFISIDLGASNGSIMTGILKDKKLVLKESYRFPHTIIEKDHSKLWNWHYLNNEIRKGLCKACSDIGEEKIESVCCCSWAQDFGLLNEQGELFYQPVSYRDDRTKGLPYKFANIISPKDLFKRNGAIISNITTLCQLYSMVENEAEHLVKADKLLFVADLINYSLCGQVSTDWTFATASQMTNIETEEWDIELTNKLGIPGKILPKINKIPKIIGKVTSNDIHSKLSGTPIISGAGHDTAVASSIVFPVHQKTAFISLGTWAMIGCHDKGIDFSTLNDYNIATLGLPWKGRGLFFSSIGLWLIQECVRMWNDEGIHVTYKELAENAVLSNIKSVIPPNDERFFSPEDMTEEIINYCNETDQAIPECPEDFAKVIFDSLVLEFKNQIEKLEKVSEVKFEKVQVVSGGSKNKYLCSKLSELVGIPVIAGPAEATSIGNIIFQARVLGLLEEEEVDEIIENSFPIVTY